MSLGGGNMKILRVLLALALTCIASPALADKFFAVTPSGAAEMIFPDAPQATIGKLSSACIDASWTVTSSSATELVCEIPMNFGQALLGQLMMGNSYSTPPRRFYRFNLAEISGVSRVQASGWMELQMAFGQMKRTDFTGPEFHNAAMAFMGGAGGKFPVGTRFPNHVVMGFESDERVVDKRMVLDVKKIDEGSPAALAGLQVGDSVSRIAKKRFKHFDEYLDATAKAAETATYDVEVTRNGKTVTLSMARAFRPDWAEKVTPTVVAATPVPASSTATASKADELAKLAKLRSDGILSDAEFEAEKVKLLNQ